ncbi:hypothetical protein MSAN_00563400 [Mycena sanguinolenta]|uniref:Uncharacterized protein n=1 Tax=Mycena sanguinolenta TaxID=230812 RepID=A0A8H6Z6M3_9AGAR|nr:hypothetical protein MSAN_00563400 [Mycena sanguinolenta]
MFDRCTCDASLHHHGPPLEAALSSMAGLFALHIMCPVDVQALVDCCRAPLRTFTYGLPACDRLRRFLALQLFITSIHLYHPLNRDPTSDFLPMLERVEALTDDLADLVVGAPVRQIKFRYRLEERETQPVKPPIFFALSAVSVVHVECMACQLVDYDELDCFLPCLETLVILQDATWGDHTTSLKYPQLANNLAVKLTRLPRLVRLVIITELGTRQRHQFCQSLRHRGKAVQLHTFAFHTGAKCLCWDNFL